MLFFRSLHNMCDIIQGNNIDILFIYRVFSFPFKKNVMPLILCKVNSGVQNT
jgi:hypothetical protein